jgi:hypothetical protein
MNRGCSEGLRSAGERGEKVGEVLVGLRRLCPRLGACPLEQYVAIAKGLPCPAPPLQFLSVPSPSRALPPAAGFLCAGSKTVGTSVLSFLVLLALAVQQDLDFLQKPVPWGLS